MTTSTLVETTADGVSLGEDPPLPLPPSLVFWSLLLSSLLLSSLPPPLLDVVVEGGVVADGVGPADDVESGADVVGSAVVDAGEEVLPGAGVADADSEVEGGELGEADVLDDESSAVVC